ncbi:MAG: ATP-binding cassette domain-containing protein [Burkholderiales bacterium]
MIAVDNVSKTYAGHVALHRTTFSFRRGATTVLIGPSGCGKSTLLRLMMGLLEPDSGRVVIDGQILGADNRYQLRHSMGYVVQDGGLFPHLTAEQNITLLARYLKRPNAAIEHRVDELAELVKLDRMLLKRYPVNLSGGQRQRAGLMRALMLDPPLLFLDEPLGALDPITRFELQRELKEVFSALAKTVVLVTHDMSEAAYFGEHILLLRAGSVVQHGSLHQLLNQPAEPYVSNFIRAQRPPPALEQAW